MDKRICKLCGAPIEIRIPIGKGDIMYYPESIEKSKSELNKCSTCGRMKLLIDKMLSKYTPDWDRFYAGTVTEIMFHAGRREVLNELRRALEEVEDV